ncbi:helix-turn-helix domain-containing protein [Peptococcus simiae]|uniref:helix-turn-helix domain-containing protein n=1 Tax=Peptococcus simiae TaxID=1643805 RepID=UPI00397F8124
MSPEARELKITLAAARCNKGLRQKEAAEALGVTPKTLSRWENSQSFPDVQNIKKIESLYGIEYRNLIFLK